MVWTAAAKAFDTLQERIGAKAIDQTIPTLLEVLHHPGESSVVYAHARDDSPLSSLVCNFFLVEDVLAIVENDDNDMVQPPCLANPPPQPLSSSDGRARPEALKLEAQAQAFLIILHCPFMPSIVNLKFKGNKSFVAFSNLSDTESLTKTWKNLIVDSDNAKSKREFKKLSKNMGDKLDKEKGSIEELEAPDFRHNASTDLVRQCAAEKERNREASQHAKPRTIKHMQFTFSLDHLSPIAANVAVSKPDLKPSAAFKETITRRRRPTTRANVAGDEANGCTSNTHIEMETSAGSRKRKNFGSSNEQPFLRFSSLFSSDFGPSALLYAQPSNTMNYGEDVTNTSSRGFSITRPTIEPPLDELLINIDATEDNHLSLQQCQSDYKVLVDSDVVMQETSQSGMLHTDSQTPRNNYDAGLATPPLSQSVKNALPQTAALTKVCSSTGTQSNTPNGRLKLTAKTHNTPTTRSSGTGGTATSVNPAGSSRDRQLCLA
ncbi:hypothetical protein BU15DRAFT_78114 [Melanogaster broomeanus]|nr:hypothetical protein BU15DRAFT_78114 [Melanogaster broomeanus]